jgi:hypothetical protein
LAIAEVCSTIVPGAHKLGDISGRPARQPYLTREEAIAELKVRGLPLDLIDLLGAIEIEAIHMGRTPPRPWS